MKRVLSLVLVLVMVLSAIVPAFAEETASLEAKDLEAYGLITGNGTDLDEASPLTRAEMAVILAKMNGKATEAEAYDIPNTLTDIEGHWAIAWISYAFDNEWMTGADDMFRPDDNLNAQEVNTLMLEALGYTVVWEEANADAEAMEIAVEAADASLVLRGEIFKTLRNILDKPQKDGTEPLGTVLALEGYVAPVVEEEVVDLAVESVTALNLMQLEVVFNQEISAAGDEDNYSMTSVGAGELTAASDFDLMEDGKTVVITLATAADQQDAETVTIDAMADGFEEVEFEVEFLDLTIPTVVKAETVGNDTVKVFFSEPMLTGLETNANYAVEDVDGNTLYVKDVTAGTNNMSALVELYATLDEDVVITVSDVEDYNGFTALTTELNATVSVDEDGPVVVEYKDASPTGITLVFNEDIESAETLADFYHTNTSTIAATVTVSGNEVDITFAAGNEMPVGTAYVYVAADAVNDLWDNDNDKQTVVVEVVVDEVAPVVEGGVDVTAQDTIEVTFSEDVVEGDDFEVTLLDEDSEEVDNAVTVTITDEVIELDFDDNLYGDYTVVIEDVEDAEGNEAATVTLTFTVDDETAPVAATEFSAVLYSKGAAAQLLVVDFGQDMNAEDIVNKDMYWIGANSFTALEAANSGLEIEFTVIEEGVEIAIDGTVVDLTGEDLTIGRMADAAGNKMTTLTEDITPVDGSLATVAIDSVELTGTKTIVLTVDGELTEIDIDQFSFQAVGSAVDLTISKVTTSLVSGDTTLTFTLSDALEANATTDGTTEVDYIVAAGAGENVYGQTLEEVADATAQVDDAVAPSVDSVVFIDDSTIEVHMTEDLDNTLFAGGVDGFSVSGGTLLDVAINGADDSVIVLTGDADFTINTNISYNDVFGLEDIAGNDLASFTESDALTAAALTVTEDATPDATVTVATNFEAAHGVVAAQDLWGAGPAATPATIGEYTITVSGVGSADDDGTDLLTVASDANGVFTFALTDADNDTDTETVTVTITHTATGEADTVVLTFGAGNVVIATEE